GGVRSGRSRLSRGRGAGARRARPGGMGVLHPRPGPDRDGANRRPGPQPSRLAGSALRAALSGRLRMTLIYVVAGEASGDVLGGRLIAALRAKRPDLEFAGIGGPRMA